MGKIKVGIMTLFYQNYNYGGVLQAYALQRAVKEVVRGETETIKFINTEKRLFPLRTAVAKKVSLRERFNPQYLKYKFFQKLVMPKHKQEIDQQLLKRNAVFDEFINKFISVSPEYNSETIVKANDRYERLLCGSDQIWKPECTCGAYFLDFVKESNRKIAYAPSIGVNYLSDEEKKYISEKIKSFQRLSVREKTGGRLLELLTEKEVFVLPDPVFLYSKEEWESILPTFRGEKPYAFSYFLGNAYENRQAVKKYCRKNRLKNIVIPFGATRNANDLYFGDIKEMEDGPLEFLNRIRNAEIVFTDSFHGMAFSFLFHKKVVLFRRDGASNPISMNSRIEDFLDIMHAKVLLWDKSRTIADIASYSIDYKKVDEILKEKRTEAFHYLKEELV